MVVLKWSRKGRRGKKERNRRKGGTTKNKAGHTGPRQAPQRTLVGRAGALTDGLDGHHDALEFAKVHLPKLASTNGLDGLQIRAVQLVLEQRATDG